MTKFARWFVIGVVSVLSALPLAAPHAALAQTSGTGTTTTQVPTTLEKKVFDAINLERTKRGLKALIWHDAAAKAARGHSYNMAQRNFFSHTDPIEGGLVTRLAKYGIKYQAAGENILMQKGYPDPVAIAVKSWMDSPGHRANILYPNFTHSGMGIVTSSTGRIYYTQIFLRPL